MSKAAGKRIQKRKARVTKKRVYESPVRQRQADETRSRIAEAAMQLLSEKGYAGMTIPAVAKAAGVAVPTVYASLGSKKGIVAELLDRARFGEQYQALVQEARKESDPLKLLEFPARISAQIYQSELPVEDLLRGAGVLAPDLASVEQEEGCRRYESQGHVIDTLQKAKLLRPGLRREEARDILWSLTSRDLFRTFVRGRGWTPEQYQEWLKETLRRELTAERGR
jgi:TetR/AcrR family transcriptional regulator, regulator of cefoperazone and chloramphenicol sensitivity